MLATYQGAESAGFGRHEAITGARFIFVNAFSFAKRFFYFDPTLYHALIVLPLLAIATPSVSRRGVVLTLIFATYYVLFGAHNFPLYFLTFWALQVCLPVFEKAQFEDVLRTALPLFWISALYGIWQKYSGYTPVEIAWIESGLGVVGAENYFLTEEIRPFSFFAGIPEFGFFVVCYLYYFVSRRNWISVLCAVALLVLIGSRGLMVAAAIGAIAVLLHRVGPSVRASAFLGFCTAIAAYLVLAVIFPIVAQVEEETSRLFLYTTFQARVLAAVEFLQSLTLSNVWFGVGHQFSDGLVPDNLYINFVNNAGLVGLGLFLLVLFRDCSSPRQLFFLVVLLAYGFFAGVIYSFYLMFNFFVAFYSASRPHAPVAGTGEA
jgi:hypothetical protein